MENLPVNIDFLINNPQVSKDAERVKNDIKGTEASAMQAAAKVAANVNTIASQQIGLIARLQGKLKEFQDKAQAATTVTGIEKANIQIQLFEREINRLKNVGKQGFDDLGNRIKSTIEKPIGAINRAEAALKLYQKYAKETFNPELLAKYNAKIEATKQKLVELNKAGTTGFDQLGKQISTTNTKTGGFLSTVGTLAGTLGIAFGVQQIITWTKELFNAGVAASGIERAFANLGRNDLIGKLREQTKGFVSDLDLERLSVKANNFNIPVDRLGQLLLFAQQRAKDTGEDVGKLTDNIIDGLGRKSTRIIDNLGISVVEIQKELKKTGDFTEAVGNIIEREMNRGGVAVDTLADKTGRLTTWFQNAKNATAGFFSRLFNRDLADNSIISKLASDQLKTYGDISKKSAVQRNKDIDAQVRKINQLSKAYTEAKKISDGYQDDTANQKTKGLGEQLAAAQAVFQNLKKQNLLLADQERIKKGIVSLDEMQAQVSAKRAEASGIVVGGKVDAAKRDKLLKEADEIQKRIDDISGKTSKAQLKKDETNAERSKRARIALLEQIGVINAEYSRKSLSKDEAEIQNVRDKFKQIAAEVARYNADPKNKVKVDGSSLDKTRDAAIKDLEAKQQLERDKVTFEAQAQLFKEYEDYKTEYGQEEADRRYKGQIGKEKTYVEYLNSLLPAKSDTTSYANYLRDYLAKEIPQAQNAAFKQSFIDNIKNLKSVEAATQNSASLRAEIERQYNKDLETLDRNRDKYTDEEFALRIQKLAENKERQLLEVKDLAFKETAYYRDAVMNVANLTLSELKRRIKQAKEELAKANLTPEQRQAATAKLNNAQAGVSALGFTQDQYGQDVKGFTKIGEKANEIAVYSQAIQSSFSELGNSIAPFNEGLADTFNAIGDVAAVAGNAAKSVASFASGDIIGGIQGAISAIAGIFTIGAKSRESARKAQAELAAYNDRVIKGEVSYNQLLRERERTLKNIAELSIKELETRDRLLNNQKSQALQDYNRLLGIIQQSGQKVTATHTEKYGGFLGIGRKTKTVQETSGLAGSSFDELEKLYTKGALTDSTKAWFEELQKVKKELDDIGMNTDEVFAQINQVATATTASSIADAIIAGFKDGKRTIQDFAEDFKGLMSEAALSVFKSNFLNARIQGFYNEFAKASAGGLTSDKIDALRASYAKIISDSAAELDSLQKVTGVDFSANGAAPKTLSNAVKGITADQADLLAGQFGGQRQATIEGNVIARQNGQSMQEQLSVMREQYLVLQKIEGNTRTSSEKLTNMDGQLMQLVSKFGSFINALGANGFKI